MLKREQDEQYEELRVLAWPGEASTCEFDELKRHLDTCGECRGHYDQFTKIVVPQLAVLNDLVPAEPEDIPGIDFDAVRSRLFKRGQAVGMVFSAEALARPETKPPKHAGILTYRGLRAAIAASILVVCTVGGYWAGRARPIQHRTASATPLGSGSKPVQSAAIAKPPAALPVRLEPIAADDRRVAFLEEQLHAAESGQDEERKKAANLASARYSLEQQLAAAQQRDDASQETVAALQTQLDGLKAKENLDETSLVEGELQIKQLEAQLSGETASLDRERQTMSANHEVGGLMAARNLHIVDVYDTDARGKTKPVFGRIFFAENKQLLFYAYDLDESRLADAKHIYRIWGEKEGAGSAPRALGVFYADDKSAQRWIFKCADPKVLSEIDSVFVTLEPANKKASHPRGQQLMFAYLRGPANHP